MPVCRSTAPLTVPLVLTAGCYRDRSLYEPILDNFHYKTASKTLNDSSVTASDPTSGKARTMTVWEYLAADDQRFPLAEVEPRLRVFALADRLSSSRVSVGGDQPKVFLYTLKHLAGLSMGKTE